MGNAETGMQAIGELGGIAVVKGVGIAPCVAVLQQHGKVALHIRYRRAGGAICIVLIGGIYRPAVVVGGVEQLVAAHNAAVLIVLHAVVYHGGKQRIMLVEA